MHDFSDGRGVHGESDPGLALMKGRLSQVDVTSWCRGPAASPCRKTRQAKVSRQYRGPSTPRPVATATGLVAQDDSLRKAFHFAGVPLSPLRGSCLCDDLRFWWTFSEAKLEGCRVQSRSQGYLPVR